MYYIEEYDEENMRERLMLVFVNQHSFSSSIILSILIIFCEFANYKLIYI